ncbi:MAG TPA: hypothetical protein VGK22_03840 [Candidatus Angelobacter sp.]
MPTSQYQTAAATKWRDYRIYGDGPHAVICPASYSVTLYSWWFEAASAVMQDHGNRRCRTEHRLEELKPQPMPRRIPAPRGLADRMERD